VDVVTAGLMDIYQRLLGLRFKQVAGEVWHEDVQLWQVEDVATSENLGTMFRALWQRCGSGIRCFFTPGSGMGKIWILDPESAIIPPDHISKSLSNNYFGSKCLILLLWIPDPVPL
jgi:hypothetical protein